jgi:hypothetical protein
MNSETLKVIDTLQRKNQEIQQLAENRILDEAAAMRDLTETRGWQMLIKDLREEQKKLSNQALGAKSLKELSYFKARVDNIELFINAPNKYLDQSKLLSRRK